MDLYYTDERNTQILLYLMKEHGIRKVIISPGATNVCFVGSIQRDGFFQLYSSVDERSAAYMACGMAAECGEPVALSCTGATASRNYIPGLTEAFYRKLPVLAITATMPIGRIGHNVPQMIDRTSSLKDIAAVSAQIPAIHDAEEEWACSVKLNEALLALRRKGGGPVHVNLTTEYSPNFHVRKLPAARAIKRLGQPDAMPPLDARRVGIFVGAHKKWRPELVEAVDRFCEKYNGAVLCDQTSNYTGKYGVFPNLVVGQEQYASPCKSMDLLIDLGDVSGAYMDLLPGRVWRVSPDGEIRDRFKKMQYVFEMEELEFFLRYAQAQKGAEAGVLYYEEFKREYGELAEKIPEMPFSNLWAAQHMHKRLPENSALHLGILNTLRSWNFFETRGDILGYANTGGFGIDGCVSALIGAALASPEKIFFGIVGDLAFFYDMNSLGNRHMPPNIRLMVVNNGKGAEFRNYNHGAARFGEEADLYMAAGGHYGNQSRELVKDYAKNLGFLYLRAGDKEEFLGSIGQFLQPDSSKRPILMEIFTEAEKESEALYLINHIKTSAAGSAKKLAKDILGEKGVTTLKKFMKK